MTSVQPTLPPHLAERLRERASTEGRSPAEVLATAVTEYLKIDPFAFTASFADDGLRGDDTDEALSRLGFGE